MKTENSMPFRKPGVIASLALLFALNGCGEGATGTADTTDIAAKGPPDHSNSPNAGDYGSSIAISNTCELAADPDTNEPVLRVTINISDKSSGDITPDFTIDGTTARAKEKGKGNDIYESVDETSYVTFTPVLGANVKDIPLCDENGFYRGPDDTVSLTASVTINVDNDNKGEYASRCSDDPDLEGNQGKIVVSAAELDALCMLP